MRDDDHLKLLLDRVEQTLQGKAAPANVQIDDTLLVGLLNYSLHLGVRDLKDEDLEQVLCTLGETVIKDCKSVADGAGLANVFQHYFGCTQSFGNCKRAAEQLLNRHIDVRLGSGGSGRDFQL